MPLPLDYESPRWIESRRSSVRAFVPPILLNAFFVLLALAAIHMARTHRVKSNRVIQIAGTIAITAAGFTFPLTARSTIRVFVDRVEVRASNFGRSTW